MEKIKTIALLTLLLVLVSLSSLKDSKAQRDKRMRLVENSFISGCYAFSRDYCPTLKEAQRYDCYQMALDLCEKQGKSFRQWIEAGK